MKSILVMIVSAALFVAASGESFQSDSAAGLDTNRTKADSLQAAAEKLEAKALALEAQLDSLNDEPHGLRNDLEEAIGNLRMEIGEIRENIEKAISGLLESQEEVEEECEKRIQGEIELRKEKSGRKQLKFSFVSGMEYSFLDTDPLLRSLVRNARSTRDNDFDFGNKGMLMLSFMWYHSLDNGIRVGNDFSGGYKQFQSEPYGNDDMNGEENPADSVIILRVIPAFLGFICEKAFDLQSMQLFGGFMIGAGTTVVIENKEPLSSDFIGGTHEEKGERSYGVVFAPVFAWDLHCGMALKPAESMSIGIDGVLRFAYAYEGFTRINDGDAFSCSPGIRLRLSFGRAV